MPSPNGKWSKGQSGNPNGRPPKSRALAELLSKASLKRYPNTQPDGTTKMEQARKIFAEHVWKALVTGQIIFDEENKIELIGRDYIALAQMVIVHLDGPAPTDIDVNTDTGGVQIIIRPATPADTAPTPDDATD